MRNVIHLSGPMGSGVRPKSFFGATREWNKMKLLTSSAVKTTRKEENHPILKTA